MHLRKIWGFTLGPEMVCKGMSCSLYDTCSLFRAIERLEGLSDTDYMAWALHKIARHKLTA